MASRVASSVGGAQQGKITDRKNVVRPHTLVKQRLRSGRKTVLCSDVQRRHVIGCGGDVTRGDVLLCDVTRTRRERRHEVPPSAMRRQVKRRPTVKNARGKQHQATMQSGTRIIRNSFPTLSQEAHQLSITSGGVASQGERSASWGGEVLHTNDNDHTDMTL